MLRHGDSYVSTLLQNKFKKKSTITYINTWAWWLISSTSSSDMKILGNGPLMPLPFVPWRRSGGLNQMAFSFFFGNHSSSRGLYPKFRKNCAMESMPQPSTFSKKYQMKQNSNNNNNNDKIFNMERWTLHQMF